MANIIAEKLSRHVRNRYNKQVFGHLYAGSSSIWFYKKWSVGYKAFDKAAEQAFNDGYVWTASFDLTAFYDSIDYSVLKHMLGEIGLEQDFSERLTKFLSQWTPSMAMAFEEQLIQPVTQSLSFYDRFGLIVDREATYRDNQKLGRLLKNARLKHNACVEVLITVQAVAWISR